MIYVNHFVLVQQHCILACVKILGVILFLHLLVIQQEMSMAGMEGG